MFKFEKMIAWQKGVEFADKAFEIADRWPQRYQFSLGEQLGRAALSITNNLVEGSGRRTPGGQRVFYDIVKGSIYEVVGVLAIAQRRKQISPAEYNSLYQSGDELASITSGLIDATFRAEAATGQSSRKLREEETEYDADDDLNTDDSNS